MGERSNSISNANQANFSTKQSLQQLTKDLTGSGNKSVSVSILVHSVDQESVVQANVNFTHFAIERQK